METQIETYLRQVIYTQMACLLRAERFWQTDTPSDHARDDPWLLRARRDLIRAQEHYLDDPECARAARGLTAEPTQADATLACSCAAAESAAAITAPSAAAAAQRPPADCSSICYASEEDDWVQSRSYSSRTSPRQTCKLLPPCNCREGQRLAKACCSKLGRAWQVLHARPAVAELWARPRITIESCMRLLYW